MPPVKPIFEWIRKKGLADSSSEGAEGKEAWRLRKLEHGMGNSNEHKKNGTKAKPFLFPAFRKNENDMMRIIKQAIDKVV